MSTSESMNLGDDLPNVSEAGSPSQRPGKRRRISASREGGNQETGLMRDGSSPGLPRFVGSSSGIHFVRAVYDLLARSSGQPVRASSHSQLVPGEDDQLNSTDEPGIVTLEMGTSGVGARLGFWRDGEVLFHNSDASMLTFERMVEWTKNYFEIWHPLLPFLHGPEVLRILEQVADHGIERVSGPEATIVRSLVSISLTDSRQLPSSRAGPVPSNLLFINLSHVASCISFVLGSPASLKNLQAALCAQLFLVSILKFNMASRMGGVIVRMAYHLGLHRCPQRYPNFTTHDILMRKRIWWSFYSVERLVCQALGLPLDVQDDDVDVCFPTAERHRHPKVSSEGEIPNTEENRQLQLLTLCAKHAQLRGMILELRHKSLHVRQDSTDKALDVQARLLMWANEVEDTAAGHIADDEDDQSGDERTLAPEEGSVASYKALLVLLQHESTIALNRPLLAKKPPTPAAQAALQACIQSSRTIIDLLQTVAQRTIDEVDITFRPALVWPLLTWTVWMSCFILTYAALEGVTSRSSALSYTKRGLQIFRRISERGTTWPESCAQAVEHLIAALKRPRSSLVPVEVSESTPSDGPGTTSASITRSRRRSKPHNSNNSSHNHSSQRDHNNAEASGTTTEGSSTGSVWSNTHPHRGFMPNDAHFPNPQIPLQYSHKHPPGADPVQPTQVPCVMAPTVYQTNDFTTDDGNWLLDPLGALDFSNFAQAGSADSAMGFNFF